MLEESATLDVARISADLEGLSARAEMVAPVIDVLLVVPRLDLDDPSVV